MELRVSASQLLGAAIVVGAGVVIGKHLGTATTELIDKVTAAVVAKKAERN